jgi:hypothetical protein
MKRRAKATDRRRKLPGVLLVRFPYYAIMWGDPEGHAEAAVTFVGGKPWFHLEFSPPTAERALAELMDYHEDLQHGRIVNVAASLPETPGGFIVEVDRETMRYLHEECPWYAGFYTNFHYRRGSGRLPTADCIPWDHHRAAVGHG